MERQPTVSLQKLLQTVATGNVHPDVVSTLASRLARLEKQLGREEQQQVAASSGGTSLKTITHLLVEALSPDAHVARARRDNSLSDHEEPSALQLDKARTVSLREGCAVLAHNPPLRQLLVDLKRSKEQIIDTVSADAVTEAGISAEAREKARTMIAGFEAFIEKHRDEIAALQLLYGSR